MFPTGTIVRIYFWVARLFIPVQEWWDRRQRRKEWS